jgi:uncharacterized protein (TIGR02391 family)
VETAHIVRALRQPVALGAVEILTALTLDQGSDALASRRGLREQLDGHADERAPPRAGRRLDEVLEWLQINGLIAWDSSRDVGDWFFVTRRGSEIANTDSGVAQIQAERRLAVDLHPSIADRVRNQFSLGEYEAAAFLAMREVEIQVRDAAQAPDSSLGVALMKDAFRPEGPLADSRLDAGEQQATMALFWGAIGVFKNPSSHRQVAFSDPVLASEVILLADLLLRLVDRIPGSATNTPTDSDGA